MFSATFFGYIVSIHITPWVRRTYADDPIAAALAAARRGPAKLPDAARTRDHGTGIGVAHQRFLQRAIFLVAQILENELCEQPRLNETEH